MKIFHCWNYKQYVLYNFQHPILLYLEISIDVVEWIDSKSIDSYTTLDPKGSLNTWPSQIRRGPASKSYEVRSIFCDKVGFVSSCFCASLVSQFVLGRKFFDILAQGNLIAKENYAQDIIFDLQVEISGPFCQQLRGIMFYF